MTSKHPKRPKDGPGKGWPVPRRTFLGLSVGALTAWLAGCRRAVALKNHYGSMNRPAALHGNWCDPAIAELNAQPNVRDKTRLIVGAAPNVSPCDWNQPERENALLVSFDPVALDTVGRDILVRHRQALGLDVGHLIEGARHLSTAQALGLGATNAGLIDLHEVVLG